MALSEEARRAVVACIARDRRHVKVVDQGVAFPVTQTGAVNGYVKMPVPVRSMKSSNLGSSRYLEGIPCTFPYS